ncbi:MAG: DUF6361 family protein [Planctomycetota bacterium]|jgi:hypothetical protein|nr:DUF6361 family protein [Planctomycetota bacterium]
MLNIGRVDFSKSDRDRVLNVLRRLSEQGAVDELGIGTIRDAFSDVFFPGTSTLQTRAKYLFLVPYICLELERGKALSPQDFINALEQNELDLIKRPHVDGAKGVIGVVAQQALRVKPSSIYWNALRTYGFFTTSMTRGEYAEYSWRTAADSHNTGGKRKLRNGNGPRDDDDATLPGNPSRRVARTGK